MCVGAHAQERVLIPTAGVSSAPAPLEGRLFMPERAPTAAVVMMHGCGGAYASSGRLSSRHQMWGEYLASLGYAALMVDSFLARELREICSIRFSDRPIKELDRVGDAYAAQAYLSSTLRIAPERIALLGWSHGGGAVLDAVSRKPVSSPAFKAAVAFYPGCTARSKRALSFNVSAPVFVLIGEADDWTPAAPCKALVAQVAARGEPMTIVTYPDAYHSFDTPGDVAPRVRKEVPNGVRPGEGVTVGPNPEARADAMVRVRDFLATHLK